MSDISLTIYLSKAMYSRLDALALHEERSVHDQILVLLAEAIYIRDAAKGLRLRPEYIQNVAQSMEENAAIWTALAKH